ncbi:CHAD domain-containing protein [Yinghuangia sp. YIM S09857]|uniref:CHAD domain-containing protein n=1 Tax=Yinghuangia sp. YIM S09857 TaxID=3436929 RepID=UPI003F52BB92
MGRSERQVKEQVEAEVEGGVEGAEAAGHAGTGDHGSGSGSGGRPPGKGAKTKKKRAKAAEAAKAAGSAKSGKSAKAGDDGPGSAAEEQSATTRLPRPRSDPDAARRPEAPGTGPRNTEPQSTEAQNTEVQNTEAPDAEASGAEAPASDAPPPAAPPIDPDQPTAEPPPAPALLPPRTAGDVLLDHLRAEAAEFLAQAPRVRDGGEDAAHRMRVAARRMRSALRTCKPLLEPGPTQALSLELRWAADSLAGERDNEVLLERLLAAFERLPARSGTPRARAAVERRLRGGLSSGHTTALRALDSADFEALARQLAEPGLGLEFTRQAARPAAEAVPRLAAKAFRTLTTGAEGLPLAHAAVAYHVPVPLSGEDDEAWHRVRILGKRARYAADLCAPEFGAPAKSLAKRMKAVTESLGTHQDAALAAEVVRELALSPRLGGAAAFVLGELYTVQRFAVAEARFTFASLWPPLRERLDEVERWGS